MGEERRGEAASDNPDLTDYMMSFSKKGDGKLSKEELNDRRLYCLFDDADTDKDGVVTREELQSIPCKERCQCGSGGGST